MNLQLTQGAEMYIQKTNKFKTVLIEYIFRTKYVPAIATARTLLKNVLVTNSKKYPSQKALDNQMSWLYGASLSSSSQRFGSDHVVSFRLKVINDRYIDGDATLLEEAFAFLQEIIFNPNVENGMFHELTFSREKINLQHYYHSIEDDKGKFANIKLNETLFHGTDQAYLGMGSDEFLETITSETLYTTYKKMLNEDSVSIYVSGDVESDRVIRNINKQPLASRSITPFGGFIKLETQSDVSRVELESDVTQGKLLFGFTSPAYYNRPEYYAGMVFNGLFGGFPHSKLFQNVREKESLAYSASSYLDYIRGIMVVSTGIAFDKKEQVEEIVLAQLNEMEKGNFSDDLIVQTKSMLINQYKQNDDSQLAALSKMYSNQLLAGKSVSEEEWIAAVNAVTREDIIEIAKSMKLQAIFFLKGENTEHA